MAKRSDQQKPGSPGSASAAKPAGRSSAGAAARSASNDNGKPASRAAKGSREVRERPAARAVKTEDKPERTVDPSGQAVNREMKRMMAKREGAADRLKRPTVPKTKRTKPVAFLKEVRGELGRVAWPTRQEVMTYSVVVLVTVAFFMIIIYGIDRVALKGVLFLIDKGGR